MYVSAVGMAYEEIRTTVFLDGFLESLDNGVFGWFSRLDPLAH
jgi:hypothetical protein